MSVERAWYESSPYLHAVVGVATILYGPGSMLMKVSGTILLAAALTIVGLRWTYRRDVGRQGIGIDQKRYVALVTQDLFYETRIR